MNRTVNVELTPVRLFHGGHRQVAIFGDVYDKGDKSCLTVHSPVFEEREIYSDSDKPLVTMTEPAVQNLFQELWNMGYRPDSGEGSVGQLGATKDHLNDMRKIVESCLGVEL